MKPIKIQKRYFEEEKKSKLSVEEKKLNIFILYIKIRLHINNIKNIYLNNIKKYLNITYYIIL